MRHIAHRTRAARLRPAALLLMLSLVGPYGCIVAPQDAPANEADAGPVGDPRTDASETVTPEARDAADETDPSEAPEPEAGAEPEPEAGVEPEVRPDGCREACADRQTNLGADTLCVDEGIACIDACALTESWMPGFREAAQDCLAEDYLCYESLAGCALRRSPDEGVRLHVNIVGINWAVPDGHAVRLRRNPHIRSADGGVEPEPASAAVVDGGFELSTSIWVPSGGATAKVWFDLDGSGGCNEGDVLRFVGIGLYDQPFALPEAETHPLATGTLNLVVDAHGVALPPLRDFQVAGGECWGAP